MDKDIASLRDSISLAKSNEKLLKASLANVSATLSTEEIRAIVTNLELEHTEILARSAPLRTGSVKPVLPEEKEQTERAWNQWSNKAALRKKICMEMWSYASWEMPEGKTRDDLWVRSPCG